MKKYGIIIADDLEFSPFVKYAGERYSLKKEKRLGCDSVSFALGDKEIVALLCGIGKVNAAAAAVYLITADRVDAILNVGLSGAVSGLRREDIVAVESTTECDFDLTPLGYEPGQKDRSLPYVFKTDEYLLALALENSEVKKAKAGCGDFFLTDKVKKDYYKTTFGINAFDMETGAIGSVCYKAGVPFLCIRKISDDADDLSSATYTEMNKREEDCLTKVVMEVIEKD